MTADDRRLDPERVASRAFATSFRGFDQDEVRRFLSELADGLRGVEEDEDAVLVELRRSRDSLTAERDELADRNRELEAEVKRLAAASSPSPGPAEQVEFNEATMTELLGKETTRVLDAARAAAREMVASAEAETTERAEQLAAEEAALAERVASETSAAEAEAKALRENAKTEAAKLSSEASAAATSLRQEAERAATKTRAEADSEAAALRSDASEEAAQAKADAQAEVLRLKTESESAAAAVRAESEADAEASADAAREQSRLMLNEAQAVREKVLADLVKRRRLGKQQLDQVKAARDRLARSLAQVRKDLDESLTELANAVPDARAAMELAGRRIPEVVDQRQAAALAEQLDTVRVEDDQADEDREALPDVDELFARIKSAEEADAAEPVASPVQETPAPTEEPKAPASAAKGSASAAKSSAPVAKTSASAAKASAPVAKKPAHAAEEPANSDEGDAVVEEPAEILPATSASPKEVTSDGPEGSEVEGSFADRDVAMTRFGPDLRRQVKRALADDQSQVLDALRRAKKINTSNLPDETKQLAAVADAMRQALIDAAAAGAASVGSDPVEGTIDQLLDTVVADLVKPLRRKVAVVIERADGDKEEALEPIRAHYREVRANLLSSLVDDGLAEAFALGLYNGLGDGTAVAWVGDPRSEPGPDCLDNTLAGAVKKPEAFPTGHLVPPGSPGCRCLVIPV